MRVGHKLGDCFVGRITGRKFEIVNVISGGNGSPALYSLACNGEIVTACESEKLQLYFDKVKENDHER